jgi:hypothetical protein
LVRPGITVKFAPGKGITAHGAVRIGEEGGAPVVFTCSDSTDTWEVPFTLLTTAEVRIVFSKDGYVPTVKKVWVNYNYQNGTASQPSSISVELHQFSYQSIRVAQSGTGSFTTISEALDFVYALTDSPEYNDESIRIIVFPGNYNENL